MTLETKGFIQDWQVTSRCRMYVDWLILLGPDWFNNLQPQTLSASNIKSQATEQTVLDVHVSFYWDSFGQLQSMYRAKAWTENESEMMTWTKVWCDWFLT